jgi:hypothetical protein
LLPLPLGLVSLPVGLLPPIEPLPCEPVSAEEPVPPEVPLVLDFVGFDLSFCFFCFFCVLVVVVLSDVPGEPLAVEPVSEEPVPDPVPDELVLPVWASAGAEASAKRDATRTLSLRMFGPLLLVRVEPRQD